MTIAEIILAIAAAIIIGLLFFYVFRVSGPWGSFWLFLLILILVGLSAEVWITPVGPVYQGFAWIPTLFVILIFAILLAAVSPPRRDVEVKEPERTDMDRSVVALSAFFWIFILFLVAAVLVGVWI